MWRMIQATGQVCICPVADTGASIVTVSTCSGAAATRTHAKTPPLRAGCVATSNVTAVRRHAAWPYTHEVIACTAKGLVGYNF